MGKLLRKWFGLAPKTKEETIWRYNKEYLQALSDWKKYKKEFDKTGDKKSGEKYLEAKQKAEFLKKELARLKENEP